MPVRLAAVGAALVMHAAAAGATDASVTLQSNAVTPVLPVPAHFRYFQRVENVGRLNIEGTAWCSSTDKAPAPFKPTSFPLAPYGNTSGIPSREVFASAGANNTAYVPQLPLWCVADGTFDGTATLHVEYVEAPF